MKNSKTPNRMVLLDVGVMKQPGWAWGGRREDSVGEKPHLERGRRHTVPATAGLPDGSPCGQEWAILKGDPVSLALD